MFNKELFSENTLALLNCAALEMERLEATSSDVQLSPQLLPYRAFPGLHVMSAGSHAFTLVTTGESKCKVTDLEFIEEVVAGVCPTETVAVFIAKPGFSIVDGSGEREECRFKAVVEAPGAYYTFKMVSSRVQVCHCVSNGDEQLAGVSMYPAFHMEVDSLLEQEDVVRKFVEKRPEPNPELLS